MYHRQHSEPSIKPIIALRRQERGRRITSSRLPTLHSKTLFQKTITHKNTHWNYCRKLSHWDRASPANESYCIRQLSRRWGTMLHTQNLQSNRLNFTYTLKGFSPRLAGSKVEMPWQTDLVSRAAQLMTAGKQNRGTMLGKERGTRCSPCCDSLLHSHTSAGLPAPASSSSGSNQT